MTTFKDGDHVRFTYDGKLDNFLHGDSFYIGEVYVENAMEDLTPHLTKIAAPEPKWQKGDVVFDTELKHTMMNTGAARWSCTCLSGASEPVTHIGAKWRAGRLVHLIRDGKPVGS